MKNKKEALFLRVDSGLNVELKSKAEEKNLSINEYCVSILANSISNGFEFQELGQITNIAKKLFQNDLLAVVIFGSRARGDFTKDSDLDVLVVLDVEHQITRDLYTTWDKEKCDIRNLSIHFSKLPGNSLSGFWCEIAIDGIIIFDKSLKVSQFLVSLRSKILSGEYKAKYSHGHRYWMEEREESRFN